MKGFYNRYLRIDATRRECSIETIPDDILKKYLGGKGLSAWLLLKHQPRGVHPLSPENAFIIATGPTTDSALYGSSRFGIYTKSPLTGVYLGSYSGGKVPEKIGRTGFDAIVVSGRCDRFSVLEISPDGASFRDGSHLKGLDCHAAEKALYSQYGTAAGILVIGPAGENLLSFAGVSNDLWHCSGRAGAGAVLGSKKIKAVVFTGDRKREHADPEGLSRFARSVLESRKDHPTTIAYRTKGTPMMVDLLNGAGAFPTRYWHQGRFEKAGRINASAMHIRMDVRPRACAHCFMACGKFSTVRDGRHKGLEVEGPEYETIYAFGGLCMIDDIAEIAYLNDLCDKFGIDTISAGNLVALTMEASETGKIAERVPYGDAEASARLIRDMVRREGLGAVLAGGIREAAKAFGMEDRAIHVKGLEPAGYDPRQLKGMGLAYATSDRGACHLRTTFYKPELSGMIPPAAIEGKAAMLIDFEDRATIFDTLIFCRFFRDFYLWDELRTIVKVTVGLDLSRQELQGLAADVTNLVRSYNIREGVTEADDTLPPRFFTEALPETGSVMNPEDFAKLKSDYYRLRGWS
ncbi:MAG TPA: aldehyde ferredoxin oxidoreductase family protein [Syntrophales bacterium]|nr:aldehyde ferredoxin oxidoreductase family protein [Syntrophales bacterium]